jgi:hypothetical protein
MRTRSPAAVSQKREFFKCLPETIGYFAPRMANIGAQRLVANSQKPAIGGPFSERQGHFLRAPDWLAGDAVPIAPVSTQIPCKQGILQGILRFRGSLDRFFSKKPLRCSHFSRNSLRTLTGKIFRRTGIFCRYQGIQGHGLRMAVSAHFSHSCFLTVRLRIIGRDRALMARYISCISVFFFSGRRIVIVRVESSSATMMCSVMVSLRM